MSTPNSELEKPKYPASWIWDEHGDLVSGTFVRFDQGQTRDYGPKTIVVLLVDGEERSVWLTQTALYNSFRDELSRRSIPELVFGERVVIERGETKRNEADTFSYRAFTVLFPDRPQPTTADLFPDLKSKQPEQKDKRDDDDIPF